MYLSGYYKKVIFIFTGKVGITILRNYEISIQFDQYINEIRILIYMRKFIIRIECNHITILNYVFVYVKLNSIF